MSECDQSTPRRRQPLSLVVGILLVSAGVIVGLVASSGVEWTRFGHAVSEKAGPVPVAIPQPAAVPIPVPGKRPPSFVEVAKAVMPAVVNILSSRGDSSGKDPHGLFDGPLFRRFFGDEFSRRFEGRRGPRQWREQGMGSGVIVDPHGIIITNHHVVREAEEIKVYLADKTEMKAELVGTDPKTDLAVLRVQGRNLPTVLWADSDELQVGEFVLAVGHPFGLNQTVTMGIVSAVGRARMGIAEYEDFIQTDAAINPGNSGGALVNTRGRLVGVNTAIFSRTGGNMGIGFAVPSNMARAVLDQLVRQGKVVRGWLGVSIQDLTPDLAARFGVTDPNGVLISDVLEDSPAEKAGFQQGDVIVEFDGKVVEDATQLKNVVAVTEVGKSVPVTMIRDSRIQTLRVTIGEQPERVARARLEEKERPVRPAGIWSGVVDQPRSGFRV